MANVINFNTMAEDCIPNRWMRNINDQTKSNLHSFGNNKVLSQFPHDGVCEKMKNSNYSLNLYDN